MACNQIIVYVLVFFALYSLTKRKIGANSAK
jgi:hypothetical protein